MTVTRKLVLKRKLKPATENIQMEGIKRPNVESHFVNDNHEIITAYGSVRKTNFAALTVSDSQGQLPPNSGNMQASSNHKWAAGLVFQQDLDDGDGSGNANAVVDERCKKTDSLRTTVYGCRSTKFLDCQKKRQGMGPRRVTQCGGILKKLMAHEYGWVFNQPVDPVKLGIPDYFSIITKPMDLGTVKNKLENMLYSNAMEFFEDVKLTFDNAMRYNPPSNSVHIMANKLTSIFTSSWKSLEARYAEQEADGLQQKTNKKTPNSRQKIVGNSSNGLKSCSRRSLVYLESSDVKVTRGDPNTQLFCKGLESSSISSKTEAINGRDVIQRYKSSLVDQQEGHYNIFSDGASGIADDVGTGAETTFGKGIEGRGEKQLLPGNSLRASVPKSRFADTINKAQTKTLLNHMSEKRESWLQQEKRNHEKKQQEEKANIQAKIEAAKAALRMKEETEKKHREKQREAARLAVQKMEKTVDFDENLCLLRDLQSIGAQKTEMSNNLAINDMDGFGPTGLGSSNVLEQLGLFMKDEDMDEEIEECFSAEMV